MKPIFVRPLSAEEHASLLAGRRSSESFTLRRCQILLASASGQTPGQLARQLGCAAQTARNAIRAFNARGLESLQARSCRPHRLARTVFDAAGAEKRRALLHQSPRDFGRPRSLWTLALAAEVAHERGLCPAPVAIETIRQALKRLGVGWQRAKDWITSPDPGYARKKRRSNA
jgi:transposase